MKQIIQSYKTGEMKLDEVPIPQVRQGTVLVETRASVVSAGTEKMLVDLAKKSLLGKAKSRPDLVKKVIETTKKEGILNTFRKVRSKLDTPIPLGYSCSGIVKAVGPGVDGFRVGDEVACGGAGYANHAEYNVVPKTLCVHIPAKDEESFEKISFEEAAFATVGAIALQGVRQAGLTLGENVCVIGLGLLGQLTVQLCKANGCEVLGADIDSSKIELARKLGADLCVDSQNLEKEALKFSRGLGVDAVIITAAAKGSELVRVAGEVSRIKGRVVVVGLVGMDIPRDTYYKKELDIRLSMSYGPGRYDAEYEERGHDYPFPYVRWTEQRNMLAFLELITAGRIDVKQLITHRYSFHDSLNAYDLILKNKDPFLGVVLEYQPSEQEHRIIVSGTPRAGKKEGVGIGLVGAGNFAKGVLLPCFSTNEKVHLVGVNTATGMSAKAVAEQFSFRYAANNADDILNDKDVDAVIIATRHNLHGPLVKKTLESGKHVFVEKPLCLTDDELQEVIKVYKSFASDSDDNKILMVGFNRRFSPVVRKIKDLLSARGTPIVATYNVNAGYIPKDSWIQDPVEGGGRIIGEVCHFVDTFRYLVGSPVKTVYATCVRSDNDSYIDKDSVSITLTYADGSIGTIIYYALGNQQYPKEKLEIAADGAVALLEDYRILETYGKKKEKIKITQDKGFDAEIKAFIDALVKGESAPIPFEELVETTKVTFAVHHSLEKGEVVQLI